MNKKWPKPISCFERLPDDGSLVLYHVKFEEDNPGAWWVGKGDVHGFYGSAGFVDTFDATHWIPVERFPKFYTMDKKYPPYNQWVIIQIPHLNDRYEIAQLQSVCDKDTLLLGTLRRQNIDPYPNIKWRHLPKGR
jgi:hypothetical protein